MTYVRSDEKEADADEHPQIWTHVGTESGLSRKGPASFRPQGNAFGSPLFRRLAA